MPVKAKPLRHKDQQQNLVILISLFDSYKGIKILTGFHLSMIS